jgi:hypothetical protein
LPRDGLLMLGRRPYRLCSSSEIEVKPKQCSPKQCRVGSLTSDVLSVIAIIWTGIEFLKLVCSLTKSGLLISLRRLFAFLEVKTRNRDVTPTTNHSQCWDLAAYSFNLEMALWIRIS